MKMFIFILVKMSENEWQWNFSFSLSWKWNFSFSLSWKWKISLSLLRSSDGAKHVAMWPQLGLSNVCVMIFDTPFVSRGHATWETNILFPAWLNLFVRWFFQLVLLLDHGHLATHLISKFSMSQIQKLNHNNNKPTPPEGGWTPMYAN